VSSARSSFQGKRILVTGGAGFIGSRLVSALVAREACVIALADDSCDLFRLEALLGEPGLRLVRCKWWESGDVNAKRREIGEIDLLAHLGLYVPPATGFQEQATSEIKMNFVPTLDLLDALGATISGVSFASSMSVYGRPARLPLKESDIPHPTTTYGASKLAIESFLQVYGCSNQVPVTVLRYSTVYGPGEMGHRAVPNFVRALSEGRAPMINGDGAERRDYVYVDDVVEATVQALALRPNRVINIGSGRAYSTLQIALEVIRLYSSTLEPVFLPRASENIDITCDISAARDELGYRPRVPISEGIKREIEWYEREARTKYLALLGDKGGQRNAAS
jgi:nucleoside-diphosphate-sugar epimerase